MFLDCSASRLAVRVHVDRGRFDICLTSISLSVKTSVPSSANLAFRRGSLMIRHAGSCLISVACRRNRHHGRVVSSGGIGRAAAYIRRIRDLRPLSDASIYPNNERDRRGLAIAYRTDRRRHGSAYFGARTQIGHARFERDRGGQPVREIVDLYRTKGLTMRQFAEKFGRSAVPRTPVRVLKPLIPFLHLRLRHF